MFLGFGYLAAVIYLVRKQKREEKRREKERARYEATPIIDRERRQAVRAVRLMLEYRRAHELEMEELLLYCHPELREKVDWKKEGF